MKIWRRGDEGNHPDMTSQISTGDDASADYPPEILLYQSEVLDRFLESSTLVKDQEERAGQLKVFETLRHRGQKRQLMTMRPTFRADLDSLKQKFPNFTEVVDYIRCCAEIAWRTDKVLRFTPILLVGEGGVGKTYFCESLAAWMAQGYHRISVSSSQDGSDLSGSSAFFTNAKPGIPFNALLYSDYANPVIFLDEIDKKSTLRYDALGALYVLLEKSTAKTYKDLCYPIEMDMSHILWLGCANDVSADSINPALLSRFRVFNIQITPEQSRKIAESIVHSTIRSLAPAADNIKFSVNAMEALTRMSPRQISQVAIEAIGRAFADDALTIERINHSVPVKRSIGFVQ